MFVQVHGFRQKGAEVAMHCEVEFRIVPFHTLQQVSDLNFGIQFLSNLTPQCLLRTLAFLHLASGKLPPPLPLAISPLSGKHLFAPHDDCRNYFYSFHIIIISYIHIRILTRFCRFRAQNAHSPPILTRFRRFRAQNGPLTSILTRFC